VCRLQTLAVLSFSRPFKTGQKLRKVSAKSVICGAPQREPGQLCPQPAGDPSP
jgi:hypothetical protein